jgi:multiple sugar transport system substrate-binding protein
MLRRGFRARALITLIIAASGATACSSANSSAPITLTYWASQQATTITKDQQLLTAELKKFTAQTGIKVNLEIPTWDVLYGKIVTAIASGGGPDVVNIGSTWGASLAATGGFVPLTDQLMAQFGGGDRFISASLESAGAPGRPPIAVPLYGSSYGLFYNTKLFAAAGITSPPATWADFVADAKLTTKPGQWGVTVVGAYDTINAHLAFILGRQNGAQLYDAAGRPQFDTPAEVAGIRQWIDLMSVDHVINPSDAEHASSEGSQEFGAGKAAMLITQTGTRAYLDSIGMTDYAVAQVPVVSPTPPGGAPVETMVAGTNIGVLENSKHQAAALQLVQFLTSEAELALLNEAYGSLPPVSSLYAQPAFSDPVTTTFGQILSEHAEPMPRVPTEGAMETVIGAAVSSLWAKAATGPVSDAEIAAALRSAQKKMPSGS